LSQLRRQLVGEQGVLLVYLFGDEGSYVVAATASEARLHAIALGEPEAKALGLAAGPLSDDGLKTVLLGSDRDGVLHGLLAREPSAATLARLAALWRVLVPAWARERLIGGGADRLLVVPDGPMALLPLETLVVASPSGGEVQYLLDAGPPILYGPSATVLYNLATRRSEAPDDAHAGVVSVGDPAYPAAGIDQVAARGAATDVAAGSRYRGLGGGLTPLPYSGLESTWVRDVFGKQGLPVDLLRGPDATEAAVRDALAGRRMIHLACHGLADQTFGNFFGALALTPGTGDDPADDGFLTLAEIYGLDLRACELAVLSACQTNYGPQQEGEGVWALSRGFLVAGSRRVVASNWLVDDKAAASLVSVLCSTIAKAEKAQQPVDYAAALHKAKRWVRGQQQWASPYFWGTFVLVGPN
jgi:CHAT domain-containing protein